MRSGATKMMSCTTGDHTTTSTHTNQLSYVRPSPPAPAIDCALRLGSSPLFAVHAKTRLPFLLLQSADSKTFSLPKKQKQTLPLTKKKTRRPRAPAKARACSSRQNNKRTASVGRLISDKQEERALRSGPGFSSFQRSASVVRACACVVTAIEAMTPPFIEHGGSSVSSSPRRRGAFRICWRGSICVCQQQRQQAFFKRGERALEFLFCPQAK